jgi:hypothetical protein
MHIPEEKAVFAVSPIQFIRVHLWLQKHPG